MLSLPALLNHLFAYELNHLKGFRQERREKAPLLCVSTSTLGMSGYPPEPSAASLTCETQKSLFISNLVKISLSQGFPEQILLVEEDIQSFSVSHNL